MSSSSNQQPIRAVSFGGGVQSTALLVLAVQKKIDFNLFIFANVGNDAENPKTIEYVNNISRPYAEQHGIEFIEVYRKRRGGDQDSLIDYIERNHSSIPIPVRMGPKATPGNRTCTKEFKISVVASETRRRGASREVPAIVGLGISIDEFHRMRTDSGIAWQLLEYPLIDLRLSRNDCYEIIRSAGLEDPPKSSCFFCPFQSDKQWAVMSKNDPDLFARSVAIERLLNERRQARGKELVWLSGKQKPLDEAFESSDLFDVPTSSSEDDPNEGCDSAGYCMI